MYPRILIFFLLLSSCIEPIDTFKLTTAKPVFDGANKLWAHRVNNPDEANMRLMRFYGIELDMFFEEENEVFDIRHDNDAPKSGLTLDLYFDQVFNEGMYYYWLDLKNLNPKNEPAITKRLDLLLDKYDLRNQVIVESKDAASLSLIGKSEIKTSYWVTAIKYNLEDPAASSSEAQAIAKELQQYKFNALSAHYQMVEFLTYHFPLATIHIWTNGLDTEEDKQLIRYFAKNKNIRVILVDYDRNFLRK